MADLEDSAALKRQLVAELHALALRGRKRWFSGTTLKPLEVPSLRKISAELYAGSSAVANATDPTEAAVSIMLANAISQLSRRTHVPGSEITWRWAAEVLFGYRRIPTNRNRKKEYDKVTDYIREVSKYPDRMDRLTGGVRGKIADVLIEQWEASRYSGTEVARGPYAPRSALEATIYQEISRAGRCILVHGDAGTGKSTLALRVAQRYLGQRHDKLFRIDASNVETLAADVYECLHRLSRDQGYIYGPPLLLLRNFAIALSEFNESRVLVLIDDVDDDSITTVLAKSGLCPHPTVTVILTSRSAFLDHKFARPIYVPNMLLTEATDMVKRKLPRISDEEASSLAECFDCRPLVIEQGIAIMAFMANPNIREFCSLFRADPAAILALAPSDKKLTTIYARVVANIDSPEFTYARKILELFFLLGSRIPESSLEAMWHEREDGGTAPSALSGYTFRIALSHLERLNLIRMDAAGNPIYYRMHVLTSELLRSTALLAGWRKPSNITTNG